VRFPLEYDALDIVSDDLKEKLLPVSTRLKEIDKERAERRKVRKRTKVGASAGPSQGKDVEMTNATGSAESSTMAPSAKGKEIAAGELDDESVYVEKENKEVEALVSPDLKNDKGCNASGLYDLIG
jgi:ubiquitin carboxyl-terminal hydrolase 14